MTQITKESLKEFGMVETDSPIFPMELKILMQPDHKCEVSLCVTCLRNTNELCLKISGGHLIYISPGSIEELATITKSITDYEWL